jgi:hypothetical protein
LGEIEVDGVVTITREGSFEHPGGQLSRIPTGVRLVTPSGAILTASENITNGITIPSGTKIWLPKGSEIDHTYSFWLPGTIHEIKGEIRGSYTFKGDLYAPLTFKLVKGIGYVYQKGGGTVLTPDGKLYKFERD